MLLLLTGYFDGVFFPGQNVGGQQTLEQLQWLERGNEEKTPGLAPVRLREGTARAVWGVAYLAQTVTFLACIGFFLVVQWRLLEARIADPGRRVAIFVGALLLSLIVGGWFGRDTSDVPQHGSSFLRAGFLAKAVKSTDLENLGRYIDFGNGLTGTLCTAGILAVCLTLTGYDPARTDHDYITSSIRRLRSVLNASALALVVGVIQVNFEYRWASNVAVGKDTEKVWEPAASAAASIILSTGGWLSLLLAAAFVPAGVILYGRTVRYNEAARLALPARPHVPLNWQKLLGDAFKIIGPVLTAGPLAAVLGK